MTEPTRTTGEALFEEYLRTQGLPFEFQKQHPSKSSQPDYTIEWRGQTLVFEVKDFDPPRGPVPRGVFYDPYKRIREKIGKGRKKFKEFKEYCCVLVLHNPGPDPFVTLHEPDIMLGSMYGDSGFMFPVNTGTGAGDISQLRQAFLGRGAMIRPHWKTADNTTISAIVTLHKIQPHYLELLDLVRANPSKSVPEHEAEIRKRSPNYDPTLEVPRVIVWYNAFARVAFPKELFCGEYDSHFGVVQVEDGLAEQNVTYEGRSVPNRIKLLKTDANL